MENWAEETIKNCVCMSDARDNAAVLNNVQEAAVTCVTALKELEDCQEIVQVVMRMLEERFNLLIEGLGYDCDAVNAIDTLTVMIGADVDNVNEEGDVSGMTETEGGIAHYCSTTLLESVVTTQLEKAEELASGIFFSEWDE